MVHFLAGYLLSHEVCDDYARDLERIVSQFSDWLGHPARLADLSDDAVNRWLVYLGKTRLAKASVANKRRMLLTIWKAADMDGLTESWPRRVRPVRCPRPSPVAWRQEEVERLLQVARGVPGRFRSGVLRADFWEAAVSTAWDTGLRSGDLRRLRWDDEVDASLYRIVQHKTGVEFWRAVQPGTRAALEKLRIPARATIFGWVLTKRHFQTQFKELAASADLVGTFKKLRKSSATAVCLAGGNASTFLGHRTPGLAAKHYLDQRILQGAAVMPPRLT